MKSQFSLKLKVQSKSNRFSRSFSKLLLTNFNFQKRKEERLLQLALVKIQRIPPKKSRIHTCTLEETKRTREKKEKRTKRWRRTNPWRILGGSRERPPASRCRSIVPRPLRGTCSEVHGHLEKHHERVLRNGGVARVCTNLLFFGNKKEGADATKSERTEKERERERERERRREKSRTGVTNDEQRRTRRGDGRVGGVCSLLPGDRVHRLLVVDAPKSRIFEKPAEQAGRDSLFHRKLPREIVPWKRKR